MLSALDIKLNTASIFRYVSKNIYLMSGAESLCYKLSGKYKFHSYWSIKFLMVNKDIKDFFLLPHKGKLNVSYSFLYLLLDIREQGLLLLQKQEVSIRNVKTT
jgi:hypothetical protein